MTASYASSVVSNWNLIKSGVANAVVAAKGGNTATANSKGDATSSFTIAKNGSEKPTLHFTVSALKNIKIVNVAAGKLKEDKKPDVSPIVIAMTVDIYKDAFKQGIDPIASLARTYEAVLNAAGQIEITTSGTGIDANNPAPLIKIANDGGDHTFDFKVKDATSMGKFTAPKNKPQIYEIVLTLNVTSTASAKANQDKAEADVTVETFGFSFS